jgi:hypothetical protein
MAVTTSDIPIPTGEGLTFEKVWAALMENREQQKENVRQMKETDRKLQEVSELQKENAREIKEYNKRFGDFTKRFGEIVEYMVAPNLQDKFDEMGLIFEEVTPHKRIKDKKHNIRFEVDVMLENLHAAMLVETKTKPTIDDINDHVKRLEKMRKYADLRGDKRKFFGAIAGVVMDDDIKEYAFKIGLYVVVPSGETFDIFIPEGEYSLREW